MNDARTTAEHTAVESAVPCCVFAPSVMSDGQKQRNRKVVEAEERTGIGAAYPTSMRLLTKAHCQSSLLPGTNHQLLIV